MALILTFTFLKFHLHANQFSKGTKRSFWWVRKLLPELPEHQENRAVAGHLRVQPGRAYAPYGTGEGWTVGWGTLRGWQGRTCDAQLSRSKFLPHQAVCKGQGRPRGWEEGW